MLSEQYLIEVRLRRDAVSSFEEYPFCLDAVRNLESVALHPEVTFLIGENGSGKSTLLEAIAVAWGFNPEGGSRNFNFSTHESHSDLHRLLRFSRGVRKARDGYFLRAESFFNVASEIEELGPEIRAAYGGISLHAQSHGESFMAVLLNRFRGEGFYILDEPEAALSPTRQMAMLARMHELASSGSQFLIATHSPILLAYPNATIYQLGPEGLIETTYQETEHFQVTQYFLNHHEKMIAELFGQED